MNSVPSRPTRDQRAAQLAAVRAEQKLSERRRRLLWIAAGTTVALAVIVPSAVVLLGASNEKASIEEAAASPIAGELDVTVPSASHVDGDVDYPTAASVDVPTGTLPPVGGDHDPIVQNCGVYTEPVRNENAVHSLEHGAVWVTYRPDLPSDDVETLSGLADGNPYLLVSPFPGLASPVVATAWGVQLELDTVDDGRLDAFVARYQQGEQTPEPGAPCAGGLGGA